jgi:hypothetical protein
MQYVSRCNTSPEPIELAVIKRLYTHARSQAWWGQLRSALARRSGDLLTLAEMDASGTLGTRRYAGIQKVSINHIRGSLGRVHDFDHDFYPLQDHNRDRWLSVAGARQRGKSLPPVDLIQVGSIYFVQDGHHRISVARALGEQDIEAEVTVWQVTGPLPWETPQPASSQASAGQPIGAEHAWVRLPREGTRLVERAAQGVHKLAGALRVALKMLDPVLGANKNPAASGGEVEEGEVGRSGGVGACCLSPATRRGWAIRQILRSHPSTLQFIGGRHPENHLFTLE